MNENTSEELSFNIAPDKNSHIEKKSRKEVVSNLIKEFSHMLEANNSLSTPSENTSTAENNLGEEYTNNPDNKNVNEDHGIMEDKFFTMFSEVDELQKEIQNSNTNEAVMDALDESTDTIDNKFLTMLSENEELDEEEQHYGNLNPEDNDAIDESTDMMVNKFLTMLSESEELEEEEQDSNMNEADNDALDKSTDTMAEKFLTMLSESDELEEEKQDGNLNKEDNDGFDENTNKMVEKFLTMLSESDELEEEKQDGNLNKEDNDGFDENTNKMVEQFLTMLSESDESQEEKQDSNTNEIEIDALDENTDILEKNFSSVFSESDELLEEKQDSSFTNFDDTKCEDDNINKNNPYNIACFKKIDDEQLYRKSTHITDFIGKKKTTTVKLPVLLAELETDVDIVESTDLLMPLDNILKVEWSVQSLDCKVVLPSKTVFLKGEFIAEIEFSNKKLENEIHSLKITIPWKKTENIHWLSVPDLPASNQKEFMFQFQQEHDSNYHYEAYQKFAEPIQSQLKQVHFVWNQELNPKEKQLQVNGVAQLSIHLMQDQFIELDCYSK
ncbi:hypothetical protein MHH37_18665 [Solibacillus sp. FSL K6-1781]|uniref:hypothetical protein n=1 Tax=Solibacillus sp. FSL K6-1781 TaxID=2921474 RepID=UPI00315AEE1C